ncbi:MAG: Nramp family divalent metal transporter, partial [Ktedonobacteraceae bacterium]|nr:Nramp family divalent metal transporter [Ktedonobacteraceae bacterium]
VPAERIQEVERTYDGESADGRVEIDASEQEIQSLAASGPEMLSMQSQDSLLDQVEQQAPTAEGMREIEHNIPSKLSQQSPLLRILGPGLLSGMSGNDSSAVTAYAADGASVGYGHLWLLLLATPLYQAVQFACARIGRVTNKGLSDLLREYYGRPISLLASFLLIATNVTLIAADLAAIGSGFELVTGLQWFWFVIPSGAALWYLTVYRNFESFKKLFLGMSFVFVAYIITAFFTHIDWGAVLIHTFVPQIDLKFDSVSSAVALLGATISPYSMFWQVQGETEQQRSGTRTQQLREARTDVASGAISGQLVAYFIILCTASTLFINHRTMSTAADAARALEPFAGPLARYLFAIGLIGSGVVAIPILLASTSYAVAGAFGWPSGLSKRPWQNEGFYLILTVAIIVGTIISLLGVQPLQLIFIANVLAGVLAPLLVLAILFVGNNRRIMHKRRLSLLNNVGLVLITAILIAAVVLLFYGLATGQGG